MSTGFNKNYYYHLFNKSIANFGIFTNNKGVERFIKILDYYNNFDKKISFSLFLRKNIKVKNNLLLLRENSIVKFISFCIMPDHYHLLIKSLSHEKISKYISDVENSYTRYFNIRNNRKGPLWQSRFKAVVIKNNLQLLHVSRYIHLNPTTNSLVNHPEDWRFSSYKEIISSPLLLKENLKEISISNRFTYKRFVENNINYQRRLKQIKKLVLE